MYTKLFLLNYILFQWQNRALGLAHSEFKNILLVIVNASCSACNKFWACLSLSHVKVIFSRKITEDPNQRCEGWKRPSCPVPLQGFFFHVCFLFQHSVCGSTFLLFHQDGSWSGEGKHITWQRGSAVFFLK